MTARQRPPLCPSDAAYLGLATIAGAEGAPVEARHLLRWPSRSRPGKEHHSSCDERGGDVRCTCEAWSYRGACGHAAGHLDALAHHGVTFGPPPADPGGAALDAARADVDGETGDWVLGGKLSPPPWLVAPSGRKNTLDALVAAMGGQWLVNRAPGRVALICPDCGRVAAMFASEDAATAWLEGGGVCGCGGGGPTPPAPGAGGRPMADLLADLYGA